MKKTIFTLFIILTFSSVKSDVHAQYRIGTVFNIEDSLMTHSNIGWTIFENFKEEYALPFSLKEFCETELDSTFSIHNNWFEMIDMDEEILNEYLLKKQTLKRKEFKKFVEKWFENDLRDYGFDAIMLIENVDPYLVYGMNATQIETEEIAISTGRNSKKTGVYIRMQVTLIYTAKPQKMKTQYYGIISEDLPMVKKGERFSDLQLMEFENALKETITKQYNEIRFDPKLVVTMRTELRRREVIRNHKE